MTLYHRIRFWFIGVIVGESSYAKNIKLDWHKKEVGVKAIAFFQDTHTEGDPDVKIEDRPGYRKKFSEVFFGVTCCCNRDPIEQGN